MKEYPTARPGAASTSPQVTEQERVARAILSFVTDPGDPAAGALARATGAAAAVEVIRSGGRAETACLTGLPNAGRWLERLRGRLAKSPSRTEVRRLLDGPARLACPGDDEWPAGLNALGDAAPAALWVIGTASLADCCQGAVAITGARAASAYGSYLAAEFASVLAGLGVTIVSGGSFGVDAAAHRGALSAGGVTVVVAAGGVDVPYPAAHADLLSAVTAQGALVSEAPPGTLPSRARFAARNRVIAALAAAMVITEAGERSGAVTAARQAKELGRVVMAVPGPVTSELSAGCHDLIRHGQAAMAIRPADVTEALAAASTPPA